LALWRNEGQREAVAWSFNFYWGLDNQYRIFQNGGWNQTDAKFHQLNTGGIQSSARKISLQKALFFQNQALSLRINKRDSIPSPRFGTVSIRKVTILFLFNHTFI
jgi:hypothetical protein